MSKRISFTVNETDYEILKEYAALRGYAKLSDLTRRAVWRFCGQNPLPGKVLGEGKIIGDMGRKPRTAPVITEP